MEIRPRTNFLRQGSNQLKTDNIDNSECVFIKYSGNISRLPNTFIPLIKPENHLEISCSFPVNRKRSKPQSSSTLAFQLRSLSIRKTPDSNNPRAKSGYAKVGRYTRFGSQSTSSYLICFQTEL